MRIKYLILFLIFVLIFGFIGCTAETTTQIKNSNIKYGLTESQRQQAFYDLIVYQDSISVNDSNRNEKMEEAYLIIAKKYGITKSEMEKIGIEGIEKNWPMP